MNWASLRRLLDHLPSPPPVDPRDPGTALRAVEAAWDLDPVDRRLAAAARALADAVTAADRLPLTVGDVRRDRLVAWTSWTTTWVGTGPDGAEALLRVTRVRDDDPVSRRALDRDARALAGLVPGLRWGPGWLAAPLPGSPLAGSVGASAPPLARRLATAVGALARWEARGLWPVAEPEQWRDVDGRLVVVALDAQAPGDAGPALAWLAGTLRPPEPDADHPLDEAALALALAPPRRASEAAEVVARALATDLAATRHTLSRRWRDTGRRDRAARLLELIERLDAATPPPEGRGAVGVDLDGRDTALESRPQGLWWGPQGAMVPLWTRADGFDAPEARRMLRARASASARRADPYTVAAGRWVATALQARTLRLLLTKELAAAHDAIEDPAG